MKNIFTIDVEDFHHRLAYSKSCKENNLQFHGTAVKGVKKIIKLLNYFSHTATFFVIGEILERNPDLADLIVENGHEIGNHTFNHTELTKFESPISFEKDLLKFDNLVMKITKTKPIGFRAPKWSVTSDTNWLFDILRKNGYKYDASIFPANGYGYGIPKAQIYPYRVDKKDFLKSNDANDFHEFPTIVLPLMNLRIPIKLRHFGTEVTKKAIDRYNISNQPGTLLLHSWEFIEPDSTLLEHGDPLKNLIRNYKISCESQVIRLFKRYQFVSIADYLAN